MNLFLYINKKRSIYLKYDTSLIHGCCTADTQGRSSVGVPDSERRVLELLDCVFENTERPSDGLACRNAERNGCHRAEGAEHTVFLQELVQFAIILVRMPEDDDTGAPVFDAGCETFQPSASLCSPRYATLVRALKNRWGRVAAPEGISSSTGKSSSLPAGSWTLWS